jgi:DNA repair protein RecO (recombination protein O)
MLRKDVGVILKSARSGETSKLVTFLGRDSGKIKVIAKGALGSKSPFRGAIEPGNVVEVVYYFKEGRTLFFLREVSVEHATGDASSSLPRMASVLAALEVLDQVCYWGSPEPRIVELARELLECEPPRDPLFQFLAFEFKLLEVLGSLPDFHVCEICGGEATDGYYHPADGVTVCHLHSRNSPQRIRLEADTRVLLENMAISGLPELARIEVPAETRKRLGKILHWTYTFHVQGYGLPEALKLIPRAEQDEL